MPYHNIMIIELAVPAPEPFVIVRQGANNDWGAYFAAGIGQSQSGNLIRVFKSECEKYGITAAVNAVFPNLTYRH